MIQKEVESETNNLNQGAIENMKRQIEMEV